MRHIQKSFSLTTAFLACFGLGSSVSVMATSIEEKIAKLELVAYYNLKTDYYDFSIIDRANGFLDSLGRTEARPAHCPLNQTSGQDLYAKLQELEAALKTTACKEYKDSFLTSYSSSVSKLGLTYLTSPAADTSSPMGTNLTQQMYYRNVAEMVGSLSSLTSDVRCALDIKERGLIPLVSDIIGSASVATLYVPSSTAFIAGISGIALSSSLKIIHSLLQPAYDMTKPKDRENFINLSCNFYDVRTSLEKSSFLRIAIARDPVTHELLRSYAQGIQSMISWLQLAKDESLTRIANDKNAFIEQRLGKDKVNFHNSLPDFAIALTPKQSSHDGGPTHSLEYRLQLFATLTEVSHALAHIHIDAEKYFLFSNIVSDVNRFMHFQALLRGEEARSSSDQDIAKDFLASMERIQQVISLEVALAERAWREQHANGELEAAVAAPFDQQIARLKTVMDRVQAKEREIASVIMKKNFSSDDDGTHRDHTVAEEIKAVTSAIYGHYGFSFFEYTREHAEKELRNFWRNYRSFFDKYLRKGNEDENRIDDEFDRRVACATASNILLSVKNSRSLVNMAADFIFTNRDFFHENIPELDFHFKVIPTGRSKETQLLAEAHSLIEARRSLEQPNKIFFPAKLKEHNPFSTPNIGELMVAQTYADGRLAGIYQFQTSNQCGF